MVIATPGRLAHHIDEVGLGMNHVEIVVYDEADRMFEMGFAEQIVMITEKMPKHRQSLLFSATLPPTLADFTLSGIREYKLIKLDHEHKISDDLKMNFYLTRSRDKLSTLLYLLSEIIQKDETTIIFTATKHHVEYLNSFLATAGFFCSYIYGSLDPTTRQVAITKVNFS